MDRTYWSCRVRKKLLKFLQDAKVTRSEISWWDYNFMFRKIDIIHVEKAEWGHSRLNISCIGSSLFVRFFSGKSWIPHCDMFPLATKFYTKMWIYSNLNSICFDLSIKGIQIMWTSINDFFSVIWHGNVEPEDDFCQGFIFTNIV